MASFNKITIVGYLGRDPELKHTPQGDAVCTFSVATTEGKGEKEKTTWFRITAWRRTAEVANEYLSKGSQVYVEGRLRLEEYTDREGNKRASAEVTASDLQFLGKAGGKDENTGTDEPAATKAEAKAALAPKSEDEVPF